MAFDDFLRKAGDAISDIKDKFDGDDEKPSQHTENTGGNNGGGGSGGGGPGLEPTNTNHRFKSSFAPSSGDVKWYVDGASYFHAVSMALEEARESIYILDWWLSPELYLRRPPARNEKYRLDNMLKAAAERGVDVRVIVYKEVKAALSCDSAHTKHALEALHPNVQVFRHPDHVPNKEDLTQSFAGISLNPMSLAKASTDALSSLYGSVGDSVLFWAHHEKLCVVDRKLVFMGGLDMCFGRWDTNSHPIADAHPGNLDAIIFPGQDFNNARAFDFEGVNNWDHNQLDRTKSPRMGWSDITISMKGPIVKSLLEHFSDRWNFIFKEKYTIKDPGKYALISSRQGGGGGGGDESHHMFGDISRGLHRGMRHVMGGEEESSGERDRGQREYSGEDDRAGGVKIQLCRSCCEWSSGHPTEHSIANAYIEAITNAEHFVYIENQFFITATSSKQRPVQNRLGTAIVDRIVRAHENGENFHVIVVMPAVPAFPGDLKSDGALGTRAIMEFQYNSICRGGSSIMESVQQRGVDDPGRYIHFYNLRNYDRLNVSSTMRRAEQGSGVPYESARRDYDNRYGEDREGEPYGGGRTYREHGDGDRGYGYSDNLRGGGYDDDEYAEDRRRGHGGGGYGGGDDSYGRSERGGYGEEGYGGEERRGYGRDHGESRREYDDRRSGNEGYGYSEGRPDEQYGRSQRRDDDSYGGREEHGGRRHHGDDEGRSGSGNYERYQQAAAKVSDRTWDTVSSCYMDGGPDIRSVPWEGSPEAEFDAFVSEELYIHSKVLIADDRLVICGSANINDRSQLGDHDSEIAVVIEDPTPLETTMDGRPFTASRFAASLRRNLYRKHIGLLPDQPWDCPQGAARAWTPVSYDPQDYDWGSRGDQLVADPMTRQFWEEVWGPVARTNTEVFERAFHPVPTDQVRNWEQYDEFFGNRFLIPGAEYKDDEKEGRVEYGHALPGEFPGGVRELKEQLARVRGTLVEMPLQFLVELGEQLAMEGVGLNFATKEIYT